MATTRGLVLGKFMPLHNGHIHLIEKAATEVDELTVLVCSIKSEPIAGVLRYHWMRTQFPNLRVLHVQDENPQEPKEHAFFWEIWINTIERNCPNGVDKVFSSEDYGDELARRLGAEHILVDRERKQVPISARQIRLNPMAHWQYIPEVVRPYYIKRVVLTGPESTGKSVLSEKLAKHFNTNFVEEYGRTYCEAFGTDLNKMDFAHIAGGQMLIEDQAALQSNKILFCDTDLIVTQIWAEIYFNHCPQWILQAAHQRKYDLFLLMDKDIPWVDDGTRAFEENRAWQYNRLKEELESRSLPYVEIKGDFDQRFDKAVAAVERMLAL